MLNSGTRASPPRARRVQAKHLCDRRAFLPSHLLCTCTVNMPTHRHTHRHACTHTPLSIPEFHTTPSEKIPWLKCTCPTGTLGHLDTGSHDPSLPRTLSCSCPFNAAPPGTLTPANPPLQMTVPCSHHFPAALEWLQPRGSCGQECMLWGPCLGSWGQSICCQAPGTPSHAHTRPKWFPSGIHTLQSN